MNLTIINLIALGSMGFLVYLLGMRRGMTRERDHHSQSWGAGYAKARDTYLEESEEYRVKLAIMRAERDRLRDFVESISVVERHGGKSGNREWANHASTWLYPGMGWGEFDVNKLEEVLGATVPTKKEEPKT